MKKFTIPHILMVGWDRTKNNYSKVLGVMLILIIFGLANKFLNGITHLNADSSMMLLSFFLHLALIILALIVGINVIKQGLVVVRGGEGNLRSLFDYPQEFWKYIGGQLLTALVVVAGFICLIVPGIILLIRLIFIKQVLVDQGLNPIESMAKCFDMTRGHTKDLFVLLVTLLVFNLAGLLFFVIGLAVTIPVTFFAVLALYDIFQKQA